MESLVAPFRAYKGSESYIFASYAHKNSDVVINISSGYGTRVFGFGMTRESGHDLGERNRDGDY